MVRSYLPDFWRMLWSWISRGRAWRIFRRKSPKKAAVPKLTVNSLREEADALTGHSEQGSVRTGDPPSPSSLGGLQVDRDGELRYATSPRSRARRIRSVSSLSYQAGSDVTILDHNNRFMSDFGEPDAEVHYNSDRGSSRHTSHDPALRERLCDLRKEAPRESHRYFIPIDDLGRLLTADTIFEELQDHGFPEDAARTSSAEISNSASRLFAILVYVRHGELILDFLSEGIDDRDLPFHRSVVSLTNPVYKLCSRRRPGQPIKCMEGWHRDLIDEFGRDQWCMLAPVFEYHDRIEHYNLQDNCVLPWVEDEERGDHEIHGGFGSVCKVAIHQAHQRFVGSASQGPLPRFVALKRLHSTNENDFKTEVAMLKKLQKRNHAHLVNLLATYRYKEHFYLMFPYAHCNLRQYWQHIPTPDFSQASIRWVLQECKGVTSALLMVHESSSTREFASATNESSTSGTSGSRPEHETRRYGRHGDIKAENILWFEKDDGSPGILVVADFGLMAFHTKDTRSDVDAKYITGSPSYEPPELQLHSKISRAFDVWCLGCLYLEFITWLVCGWEHLQRFPDARDMRGPPAPQFLRDDTFFTIVDDGNRAVVRQAVSDWIADLHEMPRASVFVHQFLDLIAEDLLVAKPSERMIIGQVNQHLVSMLSRAARDPSYLTNPKPYPRRAQQAKRFSLAAHHWHGSTKSPSVEHGVPLPKRLSGILDSKARLASRSSNLPFDQNEPPDN